MLAEINLLPKKDKENRRLVLSISLVLIVFLAVGMFLAWQIYTGKQKVRVLEQQIDSIHGQLSANESTSNDAADSATVDKWQEAVQWAEKYPIQSVQVLRHLTVLLPERGFIQTFQYEDNRVIRLTVQFDSSREAAAYLQSLLASDYIKNTSLTSLETDNVYANGEAKPLKKGIVLPRYIGTFEILIDREHFQSNQTTASGEENLVIDPEGSDP